LRAEHAVELEFDLCGQQRDDAAPEVPEGELQMADTADVALLSYSLDTPHHRLEFALDLGWQILLKRIQSGRTKINKESSLQLHYGSILQHLGEQLCTTCDEQFFIELETSHKGKNIDVVCHLGNIHAAIELKCFRKESNRATDIDMCNVLRDCERLCGYDGFEIRRFACLTDNQFYPKAKHSGHASSVSIRDGTYYKAGHSIQPSWKGKWKDTSNDMPICFNKSILMKWQQSNGWYWLILDLS
jgi:hypothetical protein